MKELSLSVIIPNYNNAEYIGKCIDSILEQTYAVNEIIIVDDCSTDESVRIILDYQKKNECIRLIRLKKNGGVSNARNIGLNNATCEYVTFIDGDDYYYNIDKLNNEMSLIFCYLKKGKDIVAYSSTVHVNNNGTIRELPKLNRKRFIKGNVLLRLIARDRTDTIPRDYCIKKSIIHSAGAYSFYKDFYEDLDLLMRLAAKLEFYCTYKNGTAYRNTDTGLSKRKMEEHTDTINEIICIYYNKLSPFKKVITKVINLTWRFKNKIKRLIRKSAGE